MYIIFLAFVAIWIVTTNEDVFINTQASIDIPYGKKSDHSFTSFDEIKNDEDI